MSRTQNQSALQQAIQDWNNGNLAAYLEIYDANVTLHGFPPNLPPGREGAKVFYDMIWTAFPQPHITLDDVMIEGDKIACRFTIHATHKDDFMGIPATGKEIALSGITILRFAGGRCVERWNQADMLGLMQQLGAAPTPDQS